MARPQDILNPDDYANYRNVRSVSVLFIILGSIFVIGGASLASGTRPDAEISPVEAIGLALVGLAGAIGGIAALIGSRRWARLAYVMAALYVLAFPIGTILSIVMLRGLSRYLDSVERLERSKKVPAKGDGAPDSAKT